MNKMKWLQEPNIGPLWAGICIGLWVLALQLFQGSQFAKDIETSLTAPSLFSLRDAWGNSPQVSDKIKVYGVDDSTVSWLNSPFLSTDQWVQLIRLIDRRKPKAIIIDSLFSIANDSYNKYSLKGLGVVTTPIYVGSFSTPRKIPYRPAISLNRTSFQLNRYIYESEQYTPSPKGEYLQNLRIYKSKDKFLYGPDPAFRRYFKNIGQILYYGDGRFIPFLKMNNRVAIPHLMLQIDDSAKFYQGQLYVNQSKLSTYKDGTAPINFSSMNHYMGKTKALRVLLDKNKNQSIQSIQEGDYVYIMPSFYTGNTDFKQTPFGPMPAGFTHLAVLNSLLTKNWLLPMNGNRLLIIILACLGSLIAIQASAAVFTICLIGGAAIWLMTASYLFVENGILLPFFTPLVSYIGPMISIFMKKSKDSERKAQYLRATFEGSIRPKELNSMIQHPERISFEAKERVLTVMFVDVVGFSILAENQVVRIAFDSLKKTLNDITESIHEYGGVVNKNLGDGLLCFFGYNLEKDKTTLDHAEKAIECAIKIQKRNIQNILSTSNEELIQPLRIGINTASVYLGNLGNSERIDFTIIGHGVNLAKRLEGACEPHSILMGVTTQEFIEPLGIYQQGLKRRLIEIKHHQRTVESWEYDPFWDMPKDRIEANVAYRSSTSQARIGKRWIVDYPENIILSTNMGNGTIMNFSNTGLCVYLPSLLVKGAVLKLYLNSIDGELKKELSQIHEGPLALEVRWGYVDQKKYLHGLQFRGLSVDEMHSIVELLCKYSLNSNRGDHRVV